MSWQTFSASATKLHSCDKWRKDGTVAKQDFFLRGNPCDLGSKSFRQKGKRVLIQHCYLGTLDHRDWETYLNLNSPCPIFRDDIDRTAWSRQDKVGISSGCAVLISCPSLASGPSLCCSTAQRQTDPELPTVEAFPQVLECVIGDASMRIRGREATGRMMVGSIHGGPMAGILTGNCFFGSS